MKKILVCLFVVAALVGMSCKSAPTRSGVTISGEVTQGKIDTALQQIYNAYRHRLDFSGSQEYTVVRGDTLADITRNFYGTLTGVGEAGTRNGFYFPLIMLASDNRIVDPDLIEPGMKLRIPDLRRNLNNPASRAALKDFLFDVAYIYNRKGETPTENGLIRLSNSL